jgi:hypothetical protein
VVLKAPVNNKMPPIYCQVKMTIVEQGASVATSAESFFCSCEASNGTQDKEDNYLIRKE